MPDDRLARSRAGRVTFLLVVLGWVLFRSHGLGQAGDFYARDGRRSTSAGSTRRSRPRRNAQAVHRARASGCASVLLPRDLVIGRVVTGRWSRRAARRPRRGRRRSPRTPRSSSPPARSAPSSTSSSDRAHLFAVLALVFFFAARRPAGGRRHGATRSRTAGWPIRRSSRRAGTRSTQTTAFFVDRMPLREQAVRANTWIALNVFDTTPDYSRAAAGGDAGARRAAVRRAATPASRTPGGRARATAADGRRGAARRAVLTGATDWLFLEEELARACEPFIDWETALRRYERLVSIIRASGRRVVFAIPPDKSTVYPEYLPDDLPRARTAARPGARARGMRSRASERPELLGLRKAMLAGKAPAARELVRLQRHALEHRRGRCSRSRAVLDAAGRARAASRTTRSHAAASRRPAI